MSSPSVPSALAAWSESLAGIVDLVGPGTLAVPGRHRRSLASAVVWRAGIAVTAAHVFRRTPATLSLLAAGGEPIEASLAGIDSSTDLAVFRIGETAAPPLTPGDASTVRTGHFVIAVGRSTGGELSASAGIVNKVSGPWETWLGGHLDRLIRLDGGVHDGLSGACVADAGGAVIGIASAALSRSYGVVVPAATVSRVVDELLSKGHVSRAFLGIGAQEVPIEPEQRTDPARAVGLLITNIVAGGPAHVGGLRIGDILVDVNGIAAASLQDLRRGLADQVGKEVSATALRGGVATKLTLRVGQWPAEGRRC